MSDSTKPARVAAAATPTSTDAAPQSQISSIETAHMATEVVQLSSAHISYQAALQTMASIKQLSLQNFLQ